MELLLLLSAIVVSLLVNDIYQRLSLKPFNKQMTSIEDVCVIDIRDYIVAHRSPYPGAENIPLSYLPRALKERFECTKEVLVVTDDKRGAKLAARMIRKKRNQSVYYIES